MLLKPQSNCQIATAARSYLRDTAASKCEFHSSSYSSYLVNLALNYEDSNCGLYYTSEKHKMVLTMSLASLSPQHTKSKIYKSVSLISHSSKPLYTEH
ncbi:hypothetical protein H920_06381 [Fukomys damarensis]|uniref:Uncharacterized protein n=1 Tax=Fukomys damarensis TaxID=885580 RepID=A0A091DPA4_FUKDA|nr:hypothetical protein H920_06381 [Fukomys damarensis]